MAMKTRAELEKIVEALNKKYLFEDAHLELATDAKMDAIIKFVKEEFVPDEPLSRSVGVEFDNEAERFFRVILQDNISLLLVTNNTNEIIAVRLTNVSNKPKADSSDEMKQLKHEKYQVLIEFLGHKDKELNAFDKFGVDKLIHYVMLGVDRRYRNKGIASKMMKAAVELYSQIGWNKVVLKGEGSSNFSKRAYEKCDFEVLHEFPYDEYKKNGEVVFKNMGEHKSTKIYAKLIVEVLNKKYIFEDAHLELATDANMDAIIKFVKEEFLPDEPLSRSIGAEVDAEGDRFLRSALSDNISLLLVTNNTNEIIAVRLTNTSNRPKADSGAEIKNVKNEKFQEVIEFFGHRDKELNAFDKFGVDRIIHFFMLGVDRRYRKKGIASKMMKAAVELYSQIGWEKVVLKGEGSSNFSKRAYEKCEFEVLHEFPYEEYKKNGEVVFKNMGEHKSTKIYAKLVTDE